MDMAELSAEGRKANFPLTQCDKMRMATFRP